MSIHQHAQNAMSALTAAFAPLSCQIMALSRKGNFSFTLVDEHGIACHSERLYPDQYMGNERLQNVIERTRKAMTA
jgi:hypothetical protein